MSRAKKITKACRNCGTDFMIPPCRDWRDHFCSPACIKQNREKKTKELEAERTRSCRKCGASFIVKVSQIKAGVGFWCSHKCYGNSDEFRAEIKNSGRAEKLVANMKDAVKNGTWKVLAGADNPRWKGGAKACAERRYKSGAAYEACKKYRAKNPHKNREWSSTRKGRILKKLPYGTVPRLILLQKGKCAICKKSVGKDYHLDHVIPLKKGGEHSPDNLQILCPRCNVRKSSKDPIEYMQSIGMLI